MCGVVVAVLVVVVVGGGSGGAWSLYLSPHAGRCDNVFPGHEVHG